MKVSELISHLQAMSPDSVVVMPDMYYDVQEGWSDEIDVKDFLEEDGVLYISETSRVKYLKYYKG